MTGALRLALWACAIASVARISLGSFSVGAHIIIIVVSAIFVRTRMNEHSIWATNKITIVFFALFFHFVISEYTTPCNDLLLKSWISFFLFSIVIFSLARLYTGPNSVDLTWDLRAIVSVVVISLLLDLVFNLISASGEAIRLGGFYPEPSHLALSLAPILVALMASEYNINRLWGIGGLFIISTLSASATIIVMVALCFSVVLLVRSTSRSLVFSIMKISVLFVLLTGLIFYSSYAQEFTSRIEGLTTSNVSTNLSSLVYVNGWETAIQNFQNTAGVGLGFNRMGCEPRPFTNTGSILSALQLADYNYNDGSFIFSKLLSELGILGALMWAAATGVVISLMLFRYEGNMDRINAETLALTLSGLTVITFGAVIRGTNYFSGSFLFGVFCIIFLWGSLMARKSH